MRAAWGPLHEVHGSTRVEVDGRWWYIVDRRCLALLLLPCARARVARAAAGVDVHGFAAASPSFIGRF